MAALDRAASAFASSCCASVSAASTRRSTRRSHLIGVQHRKNADCYSAEASKCHGHLAYNFNPPLYRLTKIISNQALRLSQSQYRSGTSSESPYGPSTSPDWHIDRSPRLSARRTSLVVLIFPSPDKDLDALDIPLPRLTRRFHRDFKNLDALDPAALGNPRLPLKPFTAEETREIVFKLMLDAEIHHVVQFDGSGPADYRSVVAFFARQLLKELRLVGGYDVLYGKVKTFMREHLFAGSPVNRRRPRAAAQPLRVGGRKGAVRLIQARHECAHDPGCWCYAH